MKDEVESELKKRRKENKGVPRKEKAGRRGEKENVITRRGKKSGRLT